ncbi:MAG: response regulator, partial [Bacteroidia bacterium]|nr:response regulator [Bacteroidia bacterium]
MSNEFNTRILIIDDEDVVRESIRQILMPNPAQTKDYSAASAALFDEKPTPVAPPEQLFEYTIQEATNGQDGLEMVRQAIARYTPFSLIFIDLRMPGWDGLTTCQKIREIDTKAQIYLLTAYSDYSASEIQARGGVDVGYLAKPFTPEEIIQLASKATYDWQRLQNLEKLLFAISGRTFDVAP